ncbi:hypothetical protein M1M90_01120 [Thermodesulfovibrionales bacterium]|nr:hypothetical protein [Thermodesulfovibrionales bacterium]
MTSFDWAVLKALALYHQKEIMTTSKLIEAVNDMLARTHNQETILWKE